MALVNGHIVVELKQGDCDSQVLDETTGLQKSRNTKGNLHRELSNFANYLLIKKKKLCYLPNSFS